MKKYLLIGITVAAFIILPKVSFAASLYVSPSSVTASAGSTFSVSVKTNTGSQPVNTAEARISYSTDTLELVSAKQGSTFYLASPGSPSKSAGSAYVGGGLPTPGYNGTAGTVGTFVFRAKAAGTGTISIDSGSVLLNDGNGTEALTSTAGARITITPPAVGGPQVSSDTDPSQDSWYASSNVTLSWTRPDGAYGFSFELDQNPNTVPDNTLDTTVTTTKSYADLKDGIYYFHIKARGQNSSSAFGATTDFKIQIDTTAPKPFEIKLAGQSDLNNVSSTPTINYDAADETSGIGSYSIILDGQQVAESSSPYTFAKINPGSHTVSVVAYDKAGNKQQADLKIIVTQEVAQSFLKRNLQLPLYVLILVNLLVLLLVLTLVWLIFRKRRRHTTQQDEILAIQAEVDETLEKLKADINQRLRNLTERQTKELYEKEEKVAREVSVTVAKTKSTIDKKMTKLSKQASRKKDRILE